MEPCTSFLVKIAPQSAAAWNAAAARTFRGEVSVDTDNAVYTFRDGALVSRATKPSRAVDTPGAMVGLRLVGFLAAEGGLWSLSPRHRPGSHAVLFRPGRPVDERSFVVTSSVVSVELDATEAVEPSPDESGVRLQRAARPPAVHRPAPASMTRLHARERARPRSSCG